MTSFASRVVPPHVFRCDPPFVPLLAATRGPWGHLWPKIAFFAQNWPFLSHFHTIGCIFLMSFATRVVPPHVVHCDPPFFPLLPALRGSIRPLMAKNGSFGPNWPFLGHFHAIRCTFLTSFASRLVLPHMFRCDPPFDPLLPAIWRLWGP